ncbi:lipopolysaccharide biosynthesis protein [Vibrio cholerae]|uniref:lipopolysaccharide biosynthesis protein n=2 Tax=Vibrio cholerae TaxID=666 RepID=UPI0018F0F25C|nr:lipopolysaccharide biosynthesis protein [Vibrio cholerae]EGR4199586.1 lipopolysaccharide biosynthesis protein [Vibrio cholerae]ELE2133768.1 lipopolysaccharide biosynthesis protein [Vibrio cholerae]MBJ6968703.1 lipopolysaccharide biosynthesis protein [Vibrio cholerae]HEJ2462277.1 lipopolysaccharide biosynthesis protein [Vibrio cholerae]
MKKEITWSIFERISTQAFQLIFLILISRTIGPDQYGLMAIIVVFIAVGNVIVDAGFSSALIRKEKVTEIDLSTLLYFSLLIALVLYAVIYSASFMIASYYDNSVLVNLIKLTGLSVIINSLCIPHKVIINHNLKFKIQAKISIVSVICSGSVGYLLATNGYGVYSLVFQTLVFSLCNLFLSIVFIGWVPILKFSLKSLRYMFAFGNKIFISSIVSTLFDNVYQIVIGKNFSPSVVGGFSQAKTLSSMPAITISTAIQRVTYSSFSKLYHNNQNYNDAFLKSLKLTALLCFPPMMILASISKPLVMIVLGSEWNHTGDFIMLLCFSYMLYPIHAQTLSILQSIGDSSSYFILEMTKKLVIIIFIYITHDDILFMIYGIVAQSYVFILVNYYFLKNRISLSFKQYCKPWVFIWIFSVMSFLLSYAFQELFSSYIEKFFSGLSLSLAIFLLLGFLFKKSLISFGIVK